MHTLRLPLKTVGKRVLCVFVSLTMATMLGLVGSQYFSGIWQPQRQAFAATGTPTALYTVLNNTAGTYYQALDATEQAAIVPRATLDNVSLGGIYPGIDGSDTSYTDSSSIPTPSGSYVDLGNYIKGESTGYQNFFWPLSYQEYYALNGGSTGSDSSKIGYFGGSNIYWLRTGFWYGSEYYASALFVNDNGGLDYNSVSSDYHARPASYFNLANLATIDPNSDAAPLETMSAEDLGTKFGLVDGVSPLDRSSAPTIMMGGVKWYVVGYGGYGVGQQSIGDANAPAGTSMGTTVGATGSAPGYVPGCATIVQADYDNGFDALSVFNQGDTYAGDAKYPHYTDDSTGGDAGSGDYALPSLTFQETYDGSALDSASTVGSIGLCTSKTSFNGSLYGKAGALLPPPAIGGTYYLWYLPPWGDAATAADWLCTGQTQALTANQPATVSLACRKISYAANGGGGTPPAAQYVPQSEASNGGVVIPFISSNGMGLTPPAGDKGATWGDATTSAASAATCTFGARFTPTAALTNDSTLYAIWGSDDSDGMTGLYAGMNMDSTHCFGAMKASTDAGTKAQAAAIVPRTDLDNVSLGKPTPGIAVDNQFVDDQGGDVSNQADMSGYIKGTSTGYQNYFWPLSFQEYYALNDNSTSWNPSYVGSIFDNYDYWLRSGFWNGNNSTAYALDVNEIDGLGTYSVNSPFLARPASYLNLDNLASAGLSAADQATLAAITPESAQAKFGLDAGTGASPVTSSTTGITITLGGVQWYVVGAYGWGVGQQAIGDMGADPGTSIGTTAGAQGSASGYVADTATIVQATYDSGFDGDDTCFTDATHITKQGDSKYPAYTDADTTETVTAPIITTTQQDIGGATQGRPYTASFTAEGSEPPALSWEVSAGSLPDGFTLDPTTGTTVQVISPAVAALPGTYSFTLRCTNAAGLYDEQDYTIKVVTAQPRVVVPTLATLAAPAAVVMGGPGSSYSTADAGPGVLLKLGAPTVTSWGGGSSLGQGFQVEMSAGKWTAFAPATYMSLSYNGKHLRYYATNSAGTGYSDTVNISVKPNSLYPVLGGANRLDTSALTIKDAWPEGSKYAVLATGADFKDALAASYLAGWLDAPVVLVSPSTKNNASVKSALKALKVSKVYTVGKAVTDTMRKSVFSGNYTKVSPKGTDGITEAIDIVKYVTGTLKKAKPTSVLITTTSGFADAMGTAAYVANPKLNMPILYVKGLNDASKAAAEVKALGSVKTTYVLGSTKVVSAKAAAQFKGVKRVYGTDRNLTAAAAFETFSPMVAKANKDGRLHSVGIAAGSDFADALGAGAAQAHLGGAVMITPPTKVGTDVHAVLTGGTFKSGVTTYKAPAIQKYLTDFCFYGLTMNAAVKKSISGYIK